MASQMPPGVHLLISVAPTLLAPPLALYALFILVQDRLPLFQSTAFRVIALILVAPLFLYTRSLWNRFRVHRAAKRLGAVPTLLYEGKLPFSFDVFRHIMSAFDEEYAMDAVAELVEKAGKKTFTLRTMGEEITYTQEPRFIKQILASNFANYVKGDHRFGDATRSVLGAGVFNADGDLWKFHRTMARPFFNRDRFSDFDIFNHHADEVIQKMKDSFAAGRPLDFQDVSARFTLDSATEFLFGDCVNSIAEPFALPGTSSKAASETPISSLPATTGFVRSFAEAQDLIGRRVRMGPVWAAFEMTRDKSKESMDHIRSYIAPILTVALEKEKKARQSRPVEKKSTEEIDDGMTFLDHMISQTQDPVILQDSIMNMLIAGRDTTACTLTYSIYMLSQHPHVLAKLREDILRVVGGHKAPTFDDIRELRYLRAVINETLRLFPPVPLNVRDTVKEDIWVTEDGTRYYIPPGRSTGYSVMLMHRDPDLWGPDALEFDPERWIDHRLSRLTENPFAFLPFNAGPRICLGQQFAYNETSFMLVRLLQAFDQIELRPDAQPAGTLPSPSWNQARGRNAIEKVWPRTHLTLYVEGGLWLTMREASAVEDA